VTEYPQLSIDGFSGHKLAIKSAFGDEVALAVGFDVVADGRALRHMHVAVEDGATDAAAASYADVREEN